LVVDTALTNDDMAYRNLPGQLMGSLKVDLKGVQVPVIYADNFRFGINGPFKVFPVMDFDQRGQAVFITDME
jgi:hypothetical protein